MADRQGVEIDYCPKCRGVWLDRGELDKIIERTGRPSVPHAEDYQPRRNQQDRGGHVRHGHDNEEHEDRDRPHGNKRRSFLSDLFD
jgi:Zn-finger nucleic acid-binding protein